MSGRLGPAAEEEQVRRIESGTRQGGVISPLLANIYVCNVLSEWFASKAHKRLRGQAHLIRYADDGAPRRRGKDARLAN